MVSVPRSPYKGAAPVAALFILLCASSFAQDTAPLHGSVTRISVHGPSLVGNLEGDSPDRHVSVYLPPGYESHKTQRYPVIYLLHGFTDSDLSWFGSDPHFDGAGAADRAIAAGVPGMIVVMPDAKTRYFGSMYSISSAIGDWETFVVRDLVAYVDSHYRTIPDRMSRGLAGHSMGGYGTLRLGMKYPEVFSSIYALSACCVAPADLHDPMWEKVTATQTDEQLAGADFLTKAVFGSAAAWSADPKNPPRFLDFPWKDGQFQPLVAAKWAANAPLIIVDQYVPNLKRLHAIALDVGTHDSLMPAVQALHDAMTADGITHAYETYDGDHVNRVAYRFETRTLPFFAKNLSFAGGKPKE